MLPFFPIQRQRCIEFRVLRAQDFYTPLALNCEKGQHLPAPEVYKNQSPKKKENCPNSLIYIRNNRCLKLRRCRPEFRCCKVLLIFGLHPQPRLGLSGGNSGKTPERPRKHSQSVSWNSPREYGWDPQNPIIQSI